MRWLVFELGAWFDAQACGVTFVPARTEGYNSLAQLLPRLDAVRLHQQAGDAPRGPRPHSAMPHAAYPQPEPLICSTEHAWLR